MTTPPAGGAGATSRIGSSRSPALVAVLVIAVVGLGIASRLLTGAPGTASPSPSGPAAASAAPAVAVSTRPVGPLPPLPEVGGGIVVESASYIALGTGFTTHELPATLDAAGDYEATFVCSGPGIGVAEIDAGRSIGVECDASVALMAWHLSEGPVTVRVEVGDAAAWHFALVGPIEAGPVPSTAPPPDVPPPAAPAAPCRPAPAAGLPSASLVTGDRSFRGATISTTAGGVVNPGLIETLPLVTLGREADLRIDGDACAVGWHIVVTLDAPNPMSLEPLATIAAYDGDRSVLENRFTLDGLPPGDSLVWATLTFHDGSETIVWRVHSDAFRFGAGILAGGGTTAFGNQNGCPSWQAGNVEGVEDCGPIPWRFGSTTTLVVSGDRRFTFSIPGWVVTGASVWWVPLGDASRLDMTARGRRVSFGPNDGVALRLPYGRLAVAVEAGAVRDGASFTQTYVFRVDHRRP